MSECQLSGANVLELQELTDPERPITYGVVKPGPEDPDTGIIFIRGGDISKGSINEANLRTITQEVSRPYARTILRSGEVIISLVGNPGEVAVVPERLAGANLARQAGLIALRPEVHAPYIKYYLMGPQGRGELFQRTQGAVQQVINLSDLKRVKVRLPAREVQQRIADVLSVYDNLIENNRRRIQLLEQAARLLYKEWFVHLRFPYHEHTKIIDGVPEGWINGSVGHLSTVRSGFAFKSKDWQQDGNPVIKIKNIAGDGTVETKFCDYINDTVAENAANFTIPVGALLIAMTGATVGKVGLLSDQSRTYYLNQRVGLFRNTNRIPVERILFPFFQESIAQTQVINLAGGAAQPNISGSQIESIKMLIPDNKILDLYLEKTKSLFEKRQNLLYQNEKLATARDLLLPKLMNGEVAV